MTSQSGTHAARGLPPGVRSLRLSGEPTHTVVLASRLPRQALEPLLTRLSAECGAVGAELVVARAASAAELRELSDAYPQILFMPAPDGSSQRELRAFGLAAAEGDIVTFADDAVGAPEGWVATMASAAPRHD